MHVRKTQELEHAPGKINPQKVQHKSQQRTPQKDRKQAIQQSQMKAIEIRDSDCTQKQSRKGRYQQKKPKEEQKRNLVTAVAAVIIMFAAVCVIVGVFIWLLRENAELQRLKQVGLQTVQTAESKQLQETLEKIHRQQRSVILNDYSWIGSEEDGKISYRNSWMHCSWQVRKILIYPSL